MTARSHTRNRRRAIKRQIARHAQWHDKHGASRRTSKRRKAAAERAREEVERTLAAFRRLESR